MRSDGLTLSQRRARRAERRLYFSLGSTFLAIVLGVIALAPSASDRLQVTVYPALDCMECGYWIEYLNDHGFALLPRLLHREATFTERCACLLASRVPS